jgi:uncharacterized protein with PIN domain
MVIDTSALLAILQEEPERRHSAESAWVEPVVPAL